jgi:hypothetical protein
LTLDVRIMRHFYRQRWLSEHFAECQLLLTFLGKEAVSGRVPSRHISSVRWFFSLWPVSWITYRAVAGIYRQRHPERTVFYKVLFQCDRLIPAYERVNIVKFLRDRENEFPMF